LAAKGPSLSAKVIYVEPTLPSDEPFPDDDEAFGSWAREGIDGEAHLRAIRAEWDERDKDLEEAWERLERNRARIHPEAG
jgi:hypothetical protein